MFYRGGERNYEVVVLMMKTLLGYWYKNFELLNIAIVTFIKMIFAF